MAADKITHVDTVLDAPRLKDGVVAMEDLPAIGDAPGATAFVHYNGPTDQLAVACMGMAVVEPGCSPHPPHQHPEEEFMIIASGHGVIEVDGKPTNVGPGAVMYCAGDVLHGMVNTGSTPLTFYFSKWMAKSAA